MSKRHRRGPDDLEQAINKLVTRPSALQPADKPIAPEPVLELTINLDLIERRKTVRKMPVPEVIECNDEETWTAWDELTAQQDIDQAKVSAVAKLRQLIKRKGNELR